jgi:hypothetical protein
MAGAMGRRRTHDVGRRMVGRRSCSRATKGRRRRQAHLARRRMMAVVSKRTKG